VDKRFAGLTLLVLSAGATPLALAFFLGIRGSSLEDGAHFLIWFALCIVLAALTVLVVLSFGPALVRRLPGLSGARARRLSYVLFYFVLSVLVPAYVWIPSFGPALAAWQAALFHVVTSVVLLSVPYLRTQADWIWMSYPLSRSGRAGASLRAEMDPDAYIEDLDWLFTVAAGRDRVDRHR
jgi:hypothetical protein